MFFSFGRKSIHSLGRLSGINPYYLKLLVGEPVRIAETRKNFFDKIKFSWLDWSIEYVLSLCLNVFTVYNLSVQNLYIWLCLELYIVEPFLGEFSFQTSLLLTISLSHQSNIDSLHRLFFIFMNSELRVETNIWLLVSKFQIDWFFTILQANFVQHFQAGLHRVIDDFKNLMILTILLI